MLVNKNNGRKANQADRLIMKNESNAKLVGTYKNDWKIWAHKPVLDKTS